MTYLPDSGRHSQRSSPRTANQALLREFVEAGRLHLSLGSVFDQPPPWAGRQSAWNRIRGMMLGLAIGDALGNTSESLLPGKRRRRHGEVRDYLPNRHADGRPVGLPSDDTQLAFWTLEHLIERGGLEPEKLARLFASRRIFGMGASVGRFVAAVHEGKPWWRASARSAGNGALMRVAPIVIPHLGRSDPGFWSDAALCAAVTHNDRGSTAACVAFAAILGELLVARRPPNPEWWVNRYVEIAREVEHESRHKPRGGPLKNTYRGPIWRFVQEQVPAAVARGESVLQAGNTWYSGAYLLETTPSVLFILARHGHDPEEAIIRAVNDTRDNDTIAAIVGAAMGALHGEEALPERWRNGLLGRTAADDDGRVQELLDRAEARFAGETGPNVTADSGTTERTARVEGDETAAEVDGGLASRAQGCLLGQLAGDSLGSLVEFERPEAILRRYPDGVRELADGGTWGTLAGQPTDDSELALMLARSLVEHGRYDQEAVRRAYVYWLESRPFDCGNTIAAGLTGPPNRRSQANGALMRVSPLGIFGARHGLEQVMDWAQQDAAITHPHEVCLQANALFAAALSFAIAAEADAEDVYAEVCRLADRTVVDPSLQDAIAGAADSPPDEYVHQQGWVLIAFRNALWQLLHATTLEEGVVNTVMRGGDTDTNAAICGALLGAVHGLDAVPEQWREAVLGCRPQTGRLNVFQPRPEIFWPVDALTLALRLAGAPGG